MNTLPKWTLVIPPSGGARMVMLQMVEAFKRVYDPNYLKTFDILNYQKAFSNLLKTPDSNLIVDLINQSLIVSCLDFGSHYLFSGALSPVTLFSLNLLKKYKVKTIHWFYEDYRKALYWKDVLSGYDIFCPIQFGQLEKACKDKKVTSCFLPTATSKISVEKSNISSKEYDIGFIGVPSTYRIVMLEELYKQGFTIAIGGEGWRNYSGILKSAIKYPFWTDERINRELYQSSRIGLQISIDQPDFSEDVHISPRVYDILSSKTYLVAEKVDLLEKFLPDVNYSTFTNVDSLKATIKTVLENYKNIESVIENNFTLVAENHTYDNRALFLLDFVNKMYSDTN